MLEIVSESDGDRFFAKISGKEKLKSRFFHGFSLVIIRPAGQVRRLLNSHESGRVGSEGFQIVVFVNSHNQVRGHRTGSSHSGVEEYPREKTQTKPKWYTHIS